MFDPESKIIDFYPEDFKIDLNGKKYAWQGVALLPFVDEIRLKAACNPLREKLTAAEIARNVRGDDRMYVREGHKGNTKNYLFIKRFEDPYLLHYFFLFKWRKKEQYDNELHVSFWAITFE